MPALRRKSSRQANATGVHPRGMAQLLGVSTDKPSGLGLSPSVNPGRSRVLGISLGDSMVVMGDWHEGGCWEKVDEMTKEPGSWDWSCSSVGGMFA